MLVVCEIDDESHVIADALSEIHYQTLDLDTRYLWKTPMFLQRLVFDVGGHRNRPTHVRLRAERCQEVSRPGATLPESSGP